MHHVASDLYSRLHKICMSCHMWAYPFGLIIEIHLRQPSSSSCRLCQTGFGLQLVDLQVRRLFATTPNSFWNRDFIIITLSLSWKSSGIRFEGRIQQLRERYFILYAISPSQENICDTFALMPSPAYLNRLRMDEKCWLLWHYCIFIFPLKLNSIWRDKCARKFGSTYALFSRLRIVHDTFRIVVYVQATHCGFSSPKSVRTCFSVCVAHRN